MGKLHRIYVSEDDHYRIEQKRLDMRFRTHHQTVKHILDSYEKMKQIEMLVNKL